MLQNRNINDYINYLLVGYAFCLPISRAAIVFFSILIFLLWIAEGDLRTKFKDIISNRFFQATFLLSFYMIITLLWSDDLKEGLHNFKRLWYYGLIFVIFTSVKKEYIKYMISAFIMAMFISEIISYGVFFEFWTFKRATPENPTPFMNHLEYSLFLATTALILINRLILSKELKEKIFYGIFFITVTGNLFLSAGRVGQLAFVCAIFLLFVLHFKNKIKAFFIVFILSFVILSSAYAISNTFNQRVNLAVLDLQKVYKKGDYSSSWGTRLTTWIVTSKILEESFFGVGIGDINSEYFKIIESDLSLKMEKEYLHAVEVGGYHSDFLEVTAGGGVIASLLFIYIFYQIFKIPIKEEEAKNIKIIIFAIFSVGLIADLFLRLQFTIALFILFVGLSLRVSKFEKEKV